MKHLLLLLAFLPVWLCGIAAGGTVSGVVVDSLSGKPMDAAGVMLIKTGATDALEALITDSTGYFLFSAVSEGSYTIRVNYTGYTTKIAAVDLSATQTSPDNLKIELVPGAGTLQEVEILSEKPVIRNMPGKIIFDVAKTVSDGAETAQESLQKIPGVNVGQDGAVTVRGKGNVRILVDGRNNPMAQANPEQFLKSIPAKNIESIEVNTAPSAKYDAEGSGIVINIKLRKGKLEGLNGSVSAGVGTVFNKFNGSGNLNYKKGKINVFGNASYNNSIQWNRSTDETKILSDTPVYFAQLLTGKGHSENGAGKVGFEYAMDSKHALTYSLDGNYWNWKSNRAGSGTVRDANRAIINTTQPGSLSDNKNLSFTNALNYRQTFDTTDRAWTIDMAHTYNTRNNTGQSYSHAFDGPGNEIAAAYFNKQTLNHSLTHNLLLQSDFNTPLKKIPDAQIEAGVKEEANLFNSNTTVNDNTSGAPVADTLQSNRFKYIESVTAAYGNFSGEYKSFTYSAGLRWEHTYITSDLNSVRQNYSSFFPTVTVGYNITDEHTISLNYGRNIERPGFWMLNNNISYTNAYAVSNGNPNIRPAFTNSVSFEYNGTIKQQSLNFSTSFSRTDGTFQEISTVDSANITHSHYENAGHEMGVYVSIDGSFKIGKNFDFSVSPGTGYWWFNYIYNNKPISTQRYEMNLWGNITYRFWKTASVQLWGWVNSGFVEAQSQGKPVGSVTISVKKKFFKDHFTVQLSCRDVFNTMTWRGRTSTPTLDNQTLWKGESRVGYLTLTYQFGKQTFSAAANKTKGKSDRLGGGGGSGGGGQ